MALNGIQANLGGDAKPWVAAAEKKITDLEREVASLKALVQQLAQRS